MISVKSVGLAEETGRCVDTLYKTDVGTYDADEVVASGDGGEMVVASIVLRLGEC